ncbi:MAG: C39 family peptidase [Christensenellales bacterium]
MNKKAGAIIIFVILLLSAGAVFLGGSAPVSWAQNSPVPIAAQEAVSVQAQPAPVPTPTLAAPLLEQVYANSSAVNIYHGPDQNAEIVAQVARRTPLLRLVDGDENGYSAIRMEDGRIGYCLASELTDALFDIPQSNMLYVHNIEQQPELPAGCEITSLAIALNYVGPYNAGRMLLAEKYLKTGPVGSTDYRKAYVGNPKDRTGHGCYAPVIVDAAQRFIEDVGGTEKVVDLSGCDAWELYETVAEGHPVIVWATIDLREPSTSATWIIDGEALTWVYPLHCMVLVGYDLEADTVTMCDPLKPGYTAYDRALFEKRFEQLESQAVVIIGGA